MSIKPNLEFENKVFSSNSYGNFKIIKYYSASKIEIEFITTKYKINNNPYCQHRKDNSSQYTPQCPFQNTPS